MHYVAGVESLVFIICFEKSIICAAVGVVIAAVVRPNLASQWGEGVSGVYSSFLSVLLRSCLSSVY